MNIHLLRRRQLLWYFGLGVGAGTLGVGLNKAVISASTPTFRDRIIPSLFVSSASRQKYLTR